MSGAERGVSFLITDGAGWTNMTLYLDSAVENIENYLSLNQATSSGFSTSDDGTTWHVDEINMGKDTTWSG